MLNVKHLERRGQSTVTPASSPDKEYPPEAFNLWAISTRHRIEDVRKWNREVQYRLDNMVARKQKQLEAWKPQIEKIRCTEPKPEDYGLPPDTPRPDYEYVGDAFYKR